ncbi:ABC transporter permease [Ruminococcus flavefaciens]|uniref:ABC transporter permease n=1 Tax=Ruminococcus flavefaciens TaxID=1265 RepID=UPI00048C3F6F|nr:ABC transporter permease [Ruminococcus flavefaciens]
MKHLISLSLKYIRRQKVRTFLTFMCIMLSAFILATVCSFGSSLYTTLYNYTEHDDGLWEVDVTNWVRQAEDYSKALDIVKNHAVVDDYLQSHSEWLSYKEHIGFFEISDGKSSSRAQMIISDSYYGNKKLSAANSPDPSFNLDTDNAEGVFLPSCFKKMGYSEGDTVTFTITPFSARLDEDSDIIKQLRAELKEKNGTSLTPMDIGFEHLSEELQQKASGANLFMSLQLRGIDIDDYPLTDLGYGEPAEYTVKIAGFTNGMKGIGTSYSFFVNTKSESVDLEKVYEKNHFLEKSLSDEMFIRVKDDCDYEKALETLFTDLGHDYNTEFYRDTFQHHENSTLLGLEWKSADAIYSILPLFVLPLLAVLLIAWFIARFIIDNAFEMAVQERSTHFAALRIMGASKGQVAAIVLIEAVFYCLTAVPLGILTAVFICRSAFNSFHRIGFPLFEFSVKGVFLAIAAGLCILAILVSAFTSAMWASRKLSPAEALNFGKPKSKKRRLRRYKSKLNLSSKRFLRRYTRKNIGASKSRFVISTITMGLGVLMFTFTALIGTFVKDVSGILNREIDCDYYVQTLYADGSFTENADKYFAGNDAFSEFRINSYFTTGITSVSDTSEVSDKRLSNILEKGMSMVFAVDKGEYNRDYFDEITGMSYEEFRDSGTAFFNISNTIYDPDAGKTTEVSERRYEKFSKPISVEGSQGFKTDVSGVVYSPKAIGYALIVPIEMADGYTTEYDMYLTVNGMKNYEKANSTMEKYINNTTLIQFEDFFMAKTGLKEFVKAIVKIILIFLISIWLVGILSMINCVNTSVLNRSRELMMLRSVGMTRKQLRKSVILETIMFSATAAVIGTLLGLGLFLIFVYLLIREPNMLHIGKVAAVLIASLTLNIIISLLSAIPAIRNLGKVEAIAQAVA